LVILDARQVCDAELPPYRLQDRHWDLGLILQEGPQVADRSELDRKTQAAVLAPTNGDQGAVILGQMKKTTGPKGKPKVEERRFPTNQVGLDRRNLCSNQMSREEHHGTK